MKTVLLMRHAKSSWKDEKLKDRDRPLNKRGQRNAPQMGELLLEKELVPQVILCSTALRARQTAEAVIEATRFDGDVRYDDSLYMAEADEYLKALYKLPDDVERVMIIGHNPGLESLLPHMTGLIEALPTAAIAYLSIPIKQWKELKKDHDDAELVALWRPKELGD